MKKISISAVAVVIAFLVLFTNCKKKEDVQPLKVGFVTGLSSLNDGGFNQMAYSGLLAAASDISITYEVRESKTAGQIDSNIRYFASNGFNVIISLGYDAGQATLDAALTYPSVKFILLDYSFATIPSNMVCATYKVDQASFPCGFLAAYQAWHKNPVQAVAAYVGGPNIPAIQQFILSFKNGVDYFNAKYGTSVSTIGANAASFNDTLQGAFLADSLIQQGAEVLFACAGKTGNGVLYKVKERSKTAIGVDTDQFNTIPQVGPYLLTSCMKRLEVFVRSELNSIYNDQFHGGQNIQSSLANQGVGLAPYHSYETLIPDSIKQAVVTIQTGITNGTILTGWSK